MPKMNYSIMPQTISIDRVSDTLDGTNTIYYVPKTSLDNIAETLGDGWTTTELTNEIATSSVNFRDNNSTRVLGNEKSIPCLINPTMYPYLYFPLFYANNMGQNLMVNIISLSGTLITWDAIGAHGTAVNTIDVYSFNSKTKALCGPVENNGNNTSAIIFSENGVMCPDRVQGSNGTNDLCVVLSDSNGEYYTTPFNNMLVGYTRTVFEPVFCRSDASIPFNGIYVLTRGDDDSEKTVVFNNITYKIFGGPHIATRPNRPKLVVSSEIVG